jgi:hemerythrin superfamily protein
MSKTDAISLLKDDHRHVKHLFEQFKAAEDRRAKAILAKEAMLELKIHTTIEEEVFYPVVRKALKKTLGKEETTDLMDEADEEHHVAKLLIAELETMKASDDHWEAKFTVLSENVLHHVKEEEGEMFPKARELDIDYDALGQQMLARKEELKAGGVPTFAEQDLIAKFGIADSPAQAALVH